MSVRSRQSLRFVLWLAVSIAILALVISHIDIDRSLAVVRSARPSLLLVLLALLLGQRVFAAYRWHVLLTCSDRSIPFTPVVRDSFVSTFVGQFLPGGVGVEAMKVYGLTRDTNDLALSLSSVFLERIISLLALILLVLVGLAALPTPVEGSIASWAWLSLLAIFLGTAMLMHPLSRRAIERLLPDWLAGRVGQGVASLYDSVDSFKRHPWVMSWVGLLSVVFQLLRVLIVAVALLAVGVEPPLVPLLIFTPIVIFLGLLPISVGGLGVPQAGFVYFLGTVGIGAEEAFAMSMLTYVLSMISTLPGAWLYLVGRSARATRNNGLGAV